MSQEQPKTQDALAAALAAGLWRRLRDVILVAERVETYAFTAADEPSKIVLGSEEATRVATDLVLRAMRAAADPAGWRIVSRIAGGDDGVALDDLAAELGLPHMATAERVNELVQVGLAGRALDVDRVYPTPAGEALVEYVRSVSGALGEQAAGWAASRGLGDGLPLL